MKNAKTLHRFNLASTLIDDSFAPSFAELHTVESIDLSHTRVGDNVGDLLSTLRNLWEITLDDTAVSDAGIQALLSGQACIETLSVRNCQISASAFLSPTVSKVQLTHLFLNGTPITG